MCGISGFIDFRNNSSLEMLKDMQETLSHRGPDDKGFEYIQESNCQVGLGHSRLSIIDTSSLGHQPMKWKEFVIVFNGEVYNYQEIRNELIENGHQFQSNSDTEVVLHAFVHWGVTCVDRFIGMFAFCIYDQNKKEVYLCRDRAGVKPLFWYWDGDLFLFASELKAFHQHPTFDKKIDKKALQLYLGYGYVPAPLAIFENSFKLLPAHWLRFSIDSKQHTIEKYWELSDYYDNSRSEMNYIDAKAELKPLIVSACNYRMVADVPVGVFLSGGYDSSLVSAILQKDRTERLKTFTIGFWQGTDEAPYAKKVAEYLGTEHQEYYCTEKDAQAIIPELPYYYDEPNADISNIPTILVSRLAKQNVKVALSADGGDELFAGYTGYKNQLARFNKFNKLPFKNAFYHLLNTSRYLFKDRLLDYQLIKKRDGLIAALQANGLESLNKLSYAAQLPPYFLVNSLLSKDNKMNSDFPMIPAYEKPYPDDIEAGNLLLLRSFESSMIDLLLVKVDRATMSSSLEGREPLLDHRLVEFAASLPYHFKHDGTTSKRILRDIAHDYIPKKLLDRPKAGFDLPIFEWLKGDLNYLIKEYLSEEQILRAGIFDYKQVNILVNKFTDNQLAYKDLFWRLIVFQMWFNKWYLKN